MEERRKTAQNGAGACTVGELEAERWKSSGFAAVISLPHALSQAFCLAGSHLPSRKGRSLSFQGQGGLPP